MPEGLKRVHPCRVHGRAVDSWRDGSNGATEASAAVGRRRTHLVEVIGEPVPIVATRAEAVSLISGESPSQTA